MGILVIVFFKEFELVGKFFKRETKNWKMLCNHALQTHIQSRLRLLHADNLKIILFYKNSQIFRKTKSAEECHLELTQKLFRVF